MRTKILPFAETKKHRKAISILQEHIQQKKRPIHLLPMQRKGWEWDPGSKENK